ncbi:MAG TPA: hypothetical protein VIK78_12710 [Ruminiclostridium sp.]
MKYAVVDLGSNSIRMSIYDQTNDNLNCILSQKELIGIIAYEKHGILAENGIIRILETLKSFLNTSKIIGSDLFFCFATASLRNIKNTEEVIKRVKSETGVEINLISGQDEARLDFLGAYGCLNFNDGLIIDMGGGSTEIIRFENGAILNLISLPFGSLYLYEKYVNEITPDKKEINLIKSFVAKQLVDIEWLPNSCNNVCLIGGTARAIARLHQELFSRQKENLQGYTFDTKDIKLLINAVDPSENGGIKLMIRVSPERLHTIIPGLIAFSKILKLSGCKTITISKNGVREGYLEEHVLNK